MQRTFRALACTPHINREFIGLINTDHRTPDLKWPLTLSLKGSGNLPCWFTRRYPVDDLRFIEVSKIYDFDHRDDPYA